MSADLRVASPKPGAVKPGFPAALTSFRLGDKVIPALTFLICLATIVYGSLMLTDNLLEIYALPLLGGICIILQLFFMDVYRQKKTLDFKLVSLSALNFLFILALLWLPRYFSGWQLNTVIHRSFFAAIFMLAGGITAMSVSIYYLLGATPQAEDASRYPYLLLPVILVLIVYLALIGQLLGSGLRYFNWDILQKAYYSYNWPVKTTIGNGWPAWTSRMQFQYGIANHIKGTGLLMLLTSLISLPIGVGAGLYLSEYGNNLLGSLARSCITSIRAISLLILAFTALSIVSWSFTTEWAPIINGTYFTGILWRSSQGGSFLTASLIISLLVIPIIARSTEEGCRSLPQELREGSIALGASDQTTLLRIVLPWALPNIVTAALLGCAEAAGSVAILMFIAGRGDYGVGPFKQVTSLAYLIFDIYFGEKSFKDTMAQYQFTAGLILLAITLVLGIASVLLKRWLVKRHRGG